MSKLVHGRYDVEAYVNAHNEVEIRVYDNSRRKVIGHLVEADEQPDTIRLDDDYFYASIWAGDKSRWNERNITVDVSLKIFQYIRREAPERAENTLYWTFSSDRFDWTQHPLWSWEASLAAEDGIMAFEPVGNTEKWLTNHIQQLEQKYRSKNPDEEIRFDF